MRPGLSHRGNFPAGLDHRGNGKGSDAARVHHDCPGEEAMARLRLATTWLGGCSGCHMSFLDLDEWLLELAAQADLVYSPILDVKEFPENVDVTLIEGAVANEEHIEQLRKVRERSKVLVSFGDCAVTGNVTAM